MSTSPSNRMRLALAAVVVIALGAVGLFVLRDDGGDVDERAVDRLGELDATAADVGERWNAAVSELEAGDPLAALRWALDEGLGLEQAQQAFDTWGVVDLYRDPDGRLKAVDLVGTYTTEADRIRFRADAIAALAAVDDLDLDRSAQVLDDDLGLADLSGPASLETDHSGLHLVLERSATQAELRITAS